MKKYKVVKVSSPEAFEISLNELAAAGWKVISANLAYENAGTEAIYFALLENNPVEEEIKQMLEENTTELDNLELGGIAPSAN